MPSLAKSATARDTEVPVPVNVRMKRRTGVLGHRDPRMTMRYQHLTPEHFRDAMQALAEAGRAASSGTITAPATKSRNAVFG